MDKNFVYKKKSVFFSTIGHTDPYNLEDYDFTTDGSMLYIARHYKPDIVQLYYTYEFSKISKSEKEKSILKLDRYEEALLSVKSDITIEESIYTEIKSPHKYSEIERSISEAVEDLRKKYPAEEYILYLNLSSGTPAMKTIMAMMSLQLEGSIGIQVEAPSYQKEDYDKYISNKTKVFNTDPKAKRVNQRYDKSWKDKPNYDQDTMAIREQQPRLMFIRHNEEYNRLSSMVKTWEYHAALKESTIAISESAMALIEVASDRIYMKFSDAKNKMEKIIEEKKKSGNPLKIDDKDLTVSDLFPFSGEAERLFEYFLIMDINAKQKKYPEVLTKVTPLMFDLFIDHVKKNIGSVVNGKAVHVNFIEECCHVDRSNPLNEKITINKDLIDEKMPGLSDDLRQLFKSKGGYRYQDDLGFLNLFRVCKANTIRCYNSEPNKNIIEAMTQIVKKNSKGRDIKFADCINGLRNMVAHHVANIDEESFKNGMGLTPEQLIDKIYQIISIVFMNDYNDAEFDKYRKSYDVLNNLILTELKKLPEERIV